MDREFEPELAIRLEDEHVGRGDHTRDEHRLGVRATDLLHLRRRRRRAERHDLIRHDLDARLLDRAAEGLADRLPEIRVVGNDGDALEVLAFRMREQRRDLRRAERPRLPEVRIVELRGQVVGRVHRRHLRRLRLHRHRLLLLRRRAERDAQDEHRALVDQLPRERGRDIGLRLVVLDQELDLLAEHAALLVDLARAEHHALGRGLRVRLRHADAVGDDADLDRVLRLRCKPNKRGAEQCKELHGSSLVNQALLSPRFRAR